MTKTKIAILGSGAWGNALAEVFSSELISLMMLSKNNYTDKNISAINRSDILLIATPAQEVRNVCIKLKNIDTSIPIIIGSKGIECSTLSLLSEVIMDELNHSNVAILSGPNFAHEIKAGLACSTTLASKDEKISLILNKHLKYKKFIIRHSTDVIGAQIYGAVKNVIAIACGLFLGKGLGNNAQAALITSGLKEITSLCIAKKGNANTALELCGIGDLILTCTSTKSRNVSFGKELANNMVYTNQFIKKNTIEGIHTSETIYNLARQLGIDMPICESVYNIIYKKSNINNEIDILLSII